VDSLCFYSVCIQDLETVLSDRAGVFILKQLGYSLLFSMRDG